jgi:hypothetical protein
MKIVDQLKLFDDEILEKSATTIAVRNKRGLKSVTMNDLQEWKVISVRACNACKRAGLKTLEDVFTHFEKFGTFTDLQSVGKSYDKELRKVYGNTVNAISGYTPFSMPTPEIDNRLELGNLKKTDTLSATQRALLEIRCREIIESCKDVRSRNMVAGIPFARLIDEMASNSQFSFATMKNVGPMMSQYLDVVLWKIRGAVVQIAAMGEEEQTRLYMRYKYPEAWNRVVKRFLAATGCVPMLHISEKYIRDDQRNGVKILLKLSDVLKATHKVDTKRVAQEMKLPVDKVRRLYVKGLEMLLDKEAVYMKYTADWQWYFTELAKNGAICDESEELEKMCEEENVHLTKKFVLTLLAAASGGEFGTINGISPRMRYKKEWKHSYLVKKALLEAFDFGKVKETIAGMLKQRRTEAEQVDIKAMLSDKWEQCGEELRKDAMEAAKIIVKCETGTEIDDEGMAELPKNAEQKMKEENTGKKRTTFQEYCNSFMTLVKEKKHFPRFCKDAEESKLARWWHRVENHSVALSAEERELTEWIKVKYGKYDMKKSEQKWIENCEKVLDFIVRNERIPSMKTEEERKMGHWIVTCYRDMYNGKMNDEQVNRFVTLDEMIETLDPTKQVN